MDSTYKERIKYFENTLRPEPEVDDDESLWKPIIDIKSFREACFSGIPDESGLRATAWKVLLGYLPPDKRMWNTVLTSQRLSYYNWVKDLLEEPGGVPPSSDHPLNDERGSRWASYFHDNSILDQIDKDVRRTLPDIAFFQTQVPKSHLNPLSRPEEAMPIMTEEPIDDPLLENNTNNNNKARRFSFGFMGRPRSSSTASKKSLRASAAANTNSNNNNTRSRSNSKSSVHSTHSNADSPSPRNIVRKFSSAFKGTGSSTSVLLPTTNHINKRKQYDIRNMKPICPHVTNRRTLFKRISHLNNENIRDATPEEVARQAHAVDLNAQDYHWEAIERILFIYAKLNPGVGYVQGMNELLAPIYYVFAKDEHPEAQAYAEADAFFVFTILMSDVRDHFVRSLDQDASTGINATMQRMSQRLAWVDKPLWRDLRRKDIKEQYYAFRWITVLCSQEWDLPSVIRLWDSILADRGSQEGLAETRFEFLLDFAVAMVLCIRQEILKGDFAENVRLLQNYPIDDIQIVLATANSLREMRLNAVANGLPVPGTYDKRNSGLYTSDNWSDSSSIHSNGSGTRLQKLRDNADMARQSFDSFRKESRESLDELFRRGRDEAMKRASAGDVTRSLSQRFASVSNKMKRPNNGILQNNDGLHRATSISSEHSTAATASPPSQQGGNLPARSNSLLNRFSQMMGNSNTSAVSPYGRLKAARNGIVEKSQQQAYYRGFV
ncbi:rab-GTPase-TBC domain-containing protein [Phascolomyces articulosus]|uniref:Rab-GTPase-TBC domain-containing protein n=1 Tax=Phascolomyces articulosus TaxID=60185 RepID=A0AAD5JPH9_9FUNG|nr:rab-GTPase-TBC domain-containing protein [Phascolomyces articulosus]